MKKPMKNLENAVNSRRDRGEKILVWFYGAYPSMPHKESPSQRLRAETAYEKLLSLPWDRNKFWLKDFYFLADWLALHKALTILDKD